MGINFPVVTMTNGLRIGNFSSPHPFTFDDGTVLPACSAERANLSKLDTVEIEKVGPSGKWTDIEISFKLNDGIRAEIAAAQKAAEEGLVDVVLIPFPVLQAMREAGVPVGALRVMRNGDRVTKIVSSSRFCI